MFKIVDEKNKTEFVFFKLLSLSLNFVLILDYLNPGLNNPVVFVVTVFSLLFKRSKHGLSYRG